jgi:outer membrane lipoprotein-sorting protein
MALTLPRPPRLLALVLCCHLAPALFGQAPSIKEIVERFDAAQAKVETLQAPFTLSIKRAMLQAPAVANGTFYLSGSDCAHFHFAAPNALNVHITPKEIISYSPAEKKGERLKLALLKRPNRKALGLGQQLPFWSDFFRLEASMPNDFPGTIMVTLIPRSLSLKKKMERAQLWIDSETYLPKRLNWVERGGDAWLLELGQMQINRPIPAAIQNFSVPPGTPMQSEFSFFKTQKK